MFPNSSQAVYSTDNVESMGEEEIKTNAATSDWLAKATI